MIKQKIWAVVKDNKVVNFVPCDLELATESQEYKAISTKKYAVELIKSGLEWLLPLRNELCPSSPYSLCQVEIKILKNKIKKSKHGKAD